jgi:hypothetical protein
MRRHWSLAGSQVTTGRPASFASSALKIAAWSFWRFDQRSMKVLGGELRLF